MALGTAKELAKELAPVSITYGSIDSCTSIYSTLPSQLVATLLAHSHLRLHDLEQFLVKILLPAGHHGHPATSEVSRMESFIVGVRKQ